MNFFPDLGEPGLLDEMFCFGPIVFQVLLGAFFYWMTGHWMKGSGRGIRIVNTAWMVLAVDLMLFFAFGFVFSLSNPSLL